MDNFFTSWFRARSATPSVPAAGPSLRDAGTITTTDPNDASNQPAVGTNWESQVVRPYGRQSLLVPAWFRGVSLIMNTMSQIVLQYQRQNPAGGNFVEDRGYFDHRMNRLSDGGRLNYLLQVRPNPLMTASELQSQIEFKKIYFGNALVYIERDEFDWPVALWLCTGGGYNPITHEYTLTYNGIDGPHIRFRAPMRNVLHFKNIFLTDDFYMGVPTIAYAMKALTIAATADEQALQDVAKGGRHKVLLQEQKQENTGTRGRANRGTLKDMRDQFADDWGTKDVVLLDNIADAKIISQTSQQLQLLEQRGHQVTDIARILDVPPILMMEGTSANYKMPEHTEQDFLTHAIQPRIRSHEDELNSKLLTIDDFGRRRIHACEQALRRLDAKGQAEIDKLHLETGWSPNELRSAYDLPSIPEGDAHYVSTNLAEVGSEKLRGTTASAPGSGSPSASPVGSVAVPQQPTEHQSDKEKKGGAS